MFLEKEKGGLSFISIFSSDLKANPRIRFNKQGSFLACIANENRIKILATDSGHQLMHTADFSLVGSGDLSDTLRKVSMLNLLIQF